MATTLNRFTKETQLTASAATMVNTSFGETKFIGKVTVTNTSASNVVITVWMIDSATTATTGSGGNWILQETVPAGRTLNLVKLAGHVINNSAKLQALADTPGVINIDISGTTET